MARFVAVILILVAAGAAVTGVSLLRFNHFTSYDSADLAACTPVVGVPGVEDAAADPRTGLAWLSSFDRRAGRGGSGGETAQRGAIMAFDPDNPLDTSSWRDRTSGVPSALRPLGLDVWQSGDVHRLFVVNVAEPSVLIYAVAASGELALIDTLSERRLTNPNAIVATGPRSFYVTNSTAGGPGGWRSTFDFLTLRPSGSILHYDGNSWSTAVGGLKFANGMEISPDGTRLYVAETAAKQLRVFSRDRELGYLQPLGRIGLPSFPDNLTWSEDGRLVVAAIPKPLSLPGFLAGRHETMPSQLFAIDTAGGRASLVYQNDGSQLSSLSVGTQIGRKLLLGAFAENKFLLCDGPVPSADV